MFLAVVELTNKRDDNQYECDEQGNIKGPSSKIKNKANQIKSEYSEADVENKCSKFHIVSIQAQAVCVYQP